MKKQLLASIKSAVIISAFISAPSLHAQAICFVNHPDNPLSVGADPFEIRSADFNGDGHPDFVTTNTNSSAVSVLLSNGTGDYLAAVNYAVGGFAPYSAAVGDIDNDGRIDIAVGNGLGNNVTFLRNSGTGIFTNAGSFAVGTYPLSTSLADLNGDNLLDIITANQTTNNVSVLLNTGSGFAAVINYSVGAQPKSSYPGDVDNDGDIDIVASSMNSGEIHVLKNNGTGTFTVGTPYSVSYGVKTITLGDLNGDNYNDIMVTRYSSGNVLTMMNDGNGDFLPFTSYFGIYTPEFSTLEDMNNDGSLDVLIASQGLPPIVIMLNDGNGNLLSPTSYPYGVSGDFTMGVTACDVNLDGKKDIAFTQFGPDKVIIRINNGFTIATASDQTICEGDSITLNASGLNNPTYVWSGGVTSGSLFAPPAPGDTYIVTGTDVNGCSSTDSVSIVVTPQPIVNAQVTDTSICEGTSVTFTGTGTAQIYTWNNSVLNGIPFTPLANNTYTVTGVDTISGCENTSSVSVLVNSLPITSLSLSIDSICVSSSPINFAGNGSPLGGNFSGTGVIGTGFDPATGLGNYTITYSYTDINGCSNSATDNLEVIACLGIDNENNIQYSAYPNPSSGNVFIDINDISNIQRISIIDISGKIIYNNSATITQHISISTADWSKGVYILQIFSDDKTFSNKLVIN